MEHLVQGNAVIPGDKRHSLAGEAPDLGVITGLCGQPGQGPFYRVTFRMDGNRFAAVAVETYGCPWANRIAGALKGLLESVPIRNASQIGPEDIVALLGGVPRNKRELPSLAIASLKDALGKVSSGAGRGTGVP